MKKITIDASSILPGRSMDGVGRTTLGLINTFSSLDLPFELSFFTQRLRGERITKYRFKKCHLPLPRWGFIATMTKKLPIIESMCKADLYHIPHNYAPIHELSKTVVTLHDAMFITHPELHLGHDELARIIPPFAQQCKAIITCSEYSKNDISKYLEIDPNKIYVIYWGIDHDLFKYIEDISEEKIRLEKEFLLKKPYFLSVSCGVGRKNTPWLVDRFLDFSSQMTKHELVLVWKNPPIEILKKIDEHPQGHKIHILQNISDTDLVSLYRCATALIFPSLYEGFGLPVLEAMACGTPVITTTSSSLPEVGGDAAIYIDTNSNELENVMSRFEKEEIDKNTMIKKGLVQSNRFTWKNCAQQTIDVYMKLLEE